MSGHRVGQVAGGGAGDGFEAKLHRFGYRHGDYSVFVRKRRVVDRIVFDIQFFDTESGAETMGAHERREAGVETDSRFAVDRQELAIAPQVMRPRGDFVAADGLSDPVVVVANVERTETVVAHMRRLVGVLLLTLAAHKALDETHGDVSRWL